jgi:ketosteroid isomerase-like protein
MSGNNKRYEVEVDRRFDRERATEFFSGYGQALTTGDLEAIARCYSYPCLVVTDVASLAISSPEQVMAAFADTDAPLATASSTRAVAGVRSIESPGEHLAWVTVRWSYRTDRDDELYSDAYRYLLRESDDDVEICTVTPVPRNWEY